MDITVRLYIRHDLDLIGLKCNPNFNFNKYMKDAVIAWANEDSNFIIPMPVPAEEKIPLKSSVFHFRLNNKEHEYVIKRLKSIRYSYRNAFLKTIFRHYLQYTPIDVFDFYNPKYDLKGNSYAGPNEETIRIRDILNRQILDGFALDEKNISESENLNSQKSETKIITETDEKDNQKSDINEKVKEEVINDANDISDKYETTDMAAVEKSDEADLKEEISNMIENPLNNIIKNNTVEENVVENNSSATPPDDESDDMGDFDLFGTIEKMM